MNVEKKGLFPSRIVRVSYAMRYLLFVVVMGTGSALLQIGNESGSTGIKLGLMIGALVLMVFGLVAMFRSVLIPRLRDAGLHAALSLLIVVPIVNLLLALSLLFIPRDAFGRGKVGSIAQGS